MNSKISDDILMDKEALYRTEESRANRFNLKCLTVLCLFVLLCELLNNLGVFVVSRQIMHISSALGMTAFLLPVLIWLIHDRILNTDISMTERGGFKYLIIFCTYAGVAVYSVILSYHAVILLAFPPIFAAQYTNQKKLRSLTLISSILVVLLGVYGGFFFGVPDRNQLYGLTFPDNRVTFAQRMTEASGKKMQELFFYFALPRIFGILVINTLISGIARRNGAMLSKQAVLGDRARREMEKRDDTQSRVIEDLAMLIESRNTGNDRHVAQTKHFIKNLARFMAQDPVFSDKLDDALIHEIESAAPLHDIGKIVIPDSILLKPGKLTPEEYETVKTHTEKGSEMIREMFANLDDPVFLETAGEMALYHHERWDGNGYPKGLAGDEIPLAARLMAVADVFDALISARVYRPAMSPADALLIIFSEGGEHFDPDITRILKEHRDEILDL